MLSAPSVPLVLRAPPVNRVSLVPVDPRVRRVMSASADLLALLVLAAVSARTDPPVFRDPLVLRVPRDPWVRLVLVAPVVPRVTRVFPAPPVMPVSRAPVVPRVNPVCVVPQVRLAGPAPLALRAPLVLPVRLVLRVPRVALAATLSSTR